MNERSDPRKVRDVMTSQVITGLPSTPFKAIVQTIRMNHVGAVPVVDVFGQVVGIVSNTDLLPKEAPQEGLGRRWFETKDRRQLRRKAAALTAAELMTTPVLAIRPGAALREAAGMLVANRVNHLPVIDISGALVGIVSRSDVLGVFTRDDEKIRAQVTEDVKRQALWPDSDVVEVGVESGVVTLDGKLDRKSDTKRLVARVRKLDGVIGTIDNLGYWWDDTKTGFERARLAQDDASARRDRGW